jgi:hypothetical protein
VIDGQQRLLTLRVWLQAILDHSSEGNVVINENFTNVYCQETDVDDWEAIKNNEWIAKYRNYKTEESGLLHAYTYFRWILWLGQESMLSQEPDELPKLPKVFDSPKNLKDIHKFWVDSLEKRSHHKTLSLLILEINSEDEDPADIFNALNGQRRELFQFDHLRNFIFANINEPELRQDLYENSWKDIEKQVEKLKIGVKGSSALDTFLYDLLIALGEKKHQQISKDKTARQFNRYFNSKRNTYNARDIAEKLILPNLVSWASVKNSGQPFEINGKTIQLPEQVRQSLVSMEWMSSGPVVPLLVNLVNRYFYEQLSLADLQRSLSLVESYLARFIVSGDPLSPMRSNIMNICASLGKAYSIDELERLLRAEKFQDKDLRKRLLPVNSKTDPYSEFGQLYSSRTARQILSIFQGIERQRAGEHCVNLLRSTQSDQLTIDHIYPRNSERWKSDLIKWNLTTVNLNKRLHTLGNLAVVPKSINSKMSNLAFDDKRGILNKNTFVKLEVNESWRSPVTTAWTPEKIDLRAEALLEDFLKYYPF